MGMTCTLRRISVENLERYLHNSYTMEIDFYSNELIEIPQLDIDKSWDGIIFLLTGNSSRNLGTNILGKVLLGSGTIDENQIIGYGPARYLLPEEVKTLNNKIKILNPDDLKFRYDPAKMILEDVYPAIWQEENAFDYIKEYFIELQSFYQHASWANEAIVIIIS